MAFPDILGSVDRVVRQQLGGAITYTPGGGSAVTVQGIFDDVSVIVDDSRAGLATTGPVVFLRLEDLTSDPVEDSAATITVGSVVYEVKEPQPDGLGGIRLLLHRVSA